MIRESTKSSEITRELINHVRDENGNLSSKIGKENNFLGDPSTCMEGILLDQHGRLGVEAKMAVENTEGEGDENMPREAVRLENSGNQIGMSQ